MVTLAYALLGAAWILASDRLLGLPVADAERQTVLQTYKGWFFIAVTTAFLYAMLRHWPREPPPVIPAYAFPAARPAIPVLIFAVLAAAICLTGYGIYRYEENALQHDTQKDLTAVGELKVAQIAQWIADQRRNAGIFTDNVMSTELLAEALQPGVPPADLRQRLTRQLAAIRQGGQYADVLLLDAQAQVRLAGRAEPSLTAAVRGLALQAMRTREVVFSDLYVDRSGARRDMICLDFLAPLIVTSGGGSYAAGVLLLRVDPHRFLYPLVQTWPAPWRTAETLLARREGDNVLYLNELRYRSATALSLRIPLSQVIPATLAAQGQRGLVTLKDYRGVPVIATLHEVPGSPWLLIAKVDAEEIEGPIRTLALAAGLIMAVLVASAGAGVWFWWRAERAGIAAAQMSREFEHEKLAQRLEFLSRYANDIILLKDAEGRILDANERAVAAYGYSHDELRGLSVHELRAPEARDTMQMDWQALKAKGGAVFETVHRRKDGTTFPVEISARMLEVQETIYLQCIIRDITERRHAEGQLRLAATVFEHCGEAVIITDADNNIIQVNPAFTTITGYAPEEVIGRNPRLLSSGRHDRDFYRTLWSSLLAGGRWQGEIWNRRRNGEVYPEWLSITVVRNERGERKNHTAIFSDITERKAAVERIQHLAHYDALTDLPNRSLLRERVSQAIASAERNRRRLAILFLDLDRFKDVNDKFGHLAGDQLLRAVADRLHGLLRKEDTASRLGGDEFLILLTEIGEGGQAEIVAQKILAAMQQPVAIGAERISISPSIGISIYPVDGLDFETLLKHADAAMYDAKQRGRNTYRWFSRGRE